jgi:DNA polymerase sigma
MTLLDSDVDFHVRLPGDNVNSASSFIFQLSRLMESHGYFRVTEAITGAKVPILRTMHIQTQMDCDVNFTNPQGYFNSCFINFIMNFDERIHSLAVIIKYWIGLNRHHVEQKQLNSYCIINLLLYYLQQLELPLLPPIFLLQINVEPVRYGPWNFAYDRSFCSKKRNTMSVFELLEGFFKFYARFDYNETVICPLYARTFDRSYFTYNLNKNPRIFQEFRGYAFAVEQLRYQRLQTRTSMCVQDPFELNSNIARSVLAKTLKQWVVLNKFAVDICEQYLDESKSEFLTKLFTESPPVLIEDDDIVPTSSKKPKLN